MNLILTLVAAIAVAALAGIMRGMGEAAVMHRRTVPAVLMCIAGRWLGYAAVATAAVCGALFVLRVLIDVLHAL